MNAVCYFNTLTLKLPTFRTTISVLYSLTSVSAILLNTLILIAIWKTTSFYKPSFMLLANLALVDFLSGSLAQPLIMAANISALHGWRDAFCFCSLAARVVAYWLGSVSLYILTIISVDRLFAIRLKNRYRSVVTMKRVKAVLLPWWIAIFVVVLSTFVFHASVKIQVIAVGIGVFVLLFVLTVCYVMSFYHLKKLSTSVASTQSANRDQRIDSNFNLLKYRKSLRTMLILFFTSICLFLPFFCAAATMAIKDVERFDQNATSLLVYEMVMTSEWIVAVSAMVNPVMYLWRMGELRRAFIRILRSIFRLKEISGIEQVEQN